MENVHGIGEQADLLSVVRGVRSRWRLKRALRGAAITVAGTFVVYAFCAWAVHQSSYSETAVVVARIVCALAFLVMVVRFIVWPLRPQVRDEQVALYLEEHEPTLEGAMLTAVEVDNASRAGIAPRSAALAQRLTASAVERARSVQSGRRVDAGELQRAWAILGGTVMVAAMVTLLGPAPLRNGLKLLAMPWKPAEASTMFSIAVEPGNMKVARGGDALVGARLRNFQSEQVVVMARPADSASWVAVPMEMDSTGRYTARLLDIAGPTEYVVEANGIKSSTYNIEVVDLPFVKNMNMEFRYPTYTGLAPEKFDSTGDIAALKGTLVKVVVETTIPTTGGRVVLDNGETLKLLPGPDGTLVAVIRVDHTGFYKVELAGPDGSMVTGSLDYTIDMLPDRSPTVRFTKPGRDTKVMAVDEVYTQAEAKDDYGVARLELVYSVNGDAERTMPLSQATSRVLTEISAGYTFMLEDYQLKAGDVVSYFARAVDNDAVSGAKSTTTDIYFLNVNPFDRNYRQGQQGPPPPPGGGQPPPQEDNPGQFSQRQRDIIAATFKAARDSAATAPKERLENVQTIRLSQQKLREEVEGLGRRLVDRGITATDTNYAKIAKMMTKAAAIMDTAEKSLGAQRLTEARGSEQRALQQLAQAEAVFRDITVQQQQQQQGGGGGGQQQQPQDLADLFELRQERLRNQYEEVQRGQAEQQQQQQQQQQQTIDSLAQKMKELAQRQQSEDERARAKEDSMSAGRPRQQQQGGGGGGGQRQSAQQAEEAARTLERLARERQSQNLQDAARAMQNAADEMRRSAAQGQSASPEAQRQLEEARRLMDQERRNAEQQTVDNALQQARQLRAEQQRVNNDVQRLGTADSAEARRSIAQRSGQMADQVRELTRQMDRIAQSTRAEDPTTSRAVREAADSVRASRLENQMRVAQQMAAGNAPTNYIRDVTEPQIARGIENLNKQLENAQRSASAAQGQQQGEQTLDKVRDVVNGFESLAERAQQQIEQQAARRLTDASVQNQQNGMQNGNRDGQRPGQNGEPQNGQQPGQGQPGQQSAGQAQGQQGGQQRLGQAQQGQSQAGRGQQQAGQGQQQASGQGGQPQPQQGRAGQGQGQPGQGQSQQGQGPGQSQQGQGQGQGQSQSQQGQGQGQGQGQSQQGQGQGQGQGQQSQQGQGQGQGQQSQGGQGQGQGQQSQQGGQGQGQNQGGQGQGQQREGQGMPQGGSPQMGGQSRNGGNGGPGGMNNGNGPNSDAQFQRELQQRIAEAQALRNELARQGRDVSDLDRSLAGLKGVSNLTSLTDERAAKQLATQVDALKEFEFQLNRAINGEKQGVRIGRTGDVPASYRQWVDQYYREIGKTPPPSQRPPQQ